MNSKDYWKSKSIDFFNFENTHSYFNPLDVKNSKLLLNNVKEFKKAFGKQHFNFKSDHNYCGWHFIFNDGNFLILTANYGGTHFEQIGNCQNETRIEFLEYVYKNIEEL